VPKECLPSDALAPRVSTDFGCDVPVLPELQQAYKNTISVRVPDNTSLMDVLEACSALYEACVYRQDKHWAKVLKDYRYYSYGAQPKDFRQVWNHRLSYPVFLWVLWRFSGDGIPSAIPLWPLEIVSETITVGRVDRGGNTIARKAPENPEEYRIRETMVPHLTEVLRLRPIAVVSIIFQNLRPVLVLPVNARFVQRTASLKNIHQ